MSRPYAPTVILYQRFSPRSEAERRKVDNEDKAARACFPSLVHSGMRPRPGGRGKRAKRAQSRNRGGATGPHIQIKIQITLSAVSLKTESVLRAVWDPRPQPNARRAESPTQNRKLSPAPIEPDPGFVSIEVGEFEMGSPVEEPGRDEGETQHTVKLTTPFMISIRWGNIAGPRTLSASIISIRPPVACHTVSASST